MMSYQVKKNKVILCYNNSDSGIQLCNYSTDK